MKNKYMNLDFRFYPMGEKVILNLLGDGIKKTRVFPPMHVCLFQI